MHIDVITLFPEMFPAFLEASLLGRARARGLLDVGIHNLRDYTHDKRRTVDDRPYGGGPGMVMKPGPLVEAIEAIRGKACPVHSQNPAGLCQTILMSPSGEPLTSVLAAQLARASHLMLICGHYEGIDERIRLSVVDRAISIGDYVLMGGELPAMVLIDCVARFVPGVIGHRRSTEEESFSGSLLEYPHYTRPVVFRGLEVPSVLRSGNHKQIAQWRKVQAMARTLAWRPDLLQQKQ